MFPTSLQLGEDTRGRELQGDLAGCNGNVRPETGLHWATHVIFGPLETGLLSPGPYPGLVTTDSI